MRPGKFEGCADQATAERLYAYTLDGGVDDEFGSVTESGLWVGLIADAIVQEDEQGFFTYDLFESEAEARRVFDYLEEHEDSDDP